MTEHELWRRVADVADGSVGLCDLLGRCCPVNTDPLAACDCRSAREHVWATFGDYGCYAWGQDGDTDYDPEARLTALGFLLAWTDPTGPGGPLED